MQALPISVKKLQIRPTPRETSIPDSQLNQISFFRSTSLIAHGGTS